MTTGIIDGKTKSAAPAKLKLVADHADAALAGLYAGQPGARQLLPMLTVLKEMRRNLAEDWPAADRTLGTYAVNEGRYTQAEANQDHAEACGQIWLRVVEFDKAIASIQRLLDLGSPTG